MVFLQWRFKQVILSVGSMDIMLLYIWLWLATSFYQFYCLKCMPSGRSRGCKHFSSHEIKIALGTWAVKKDHILIYSRRLTGWCFILFSLYIHSYIYNSELSLIRFRTRLLRRPHAFSIFWVWYLAGTIPVGSRAGGNLLSRHSGVPTTCKNEINFKMLFRFVRAIT